MKFKQILLKKVGYIFIPLFLTTFFTGCFYINIDGSNNYQRLINSMISSSYDKLKLNVEKDEVVLVSDFVNIDKLQNHSKLGFLLSEVLKDVLSNKDIIVREVELGQNFKIGEHGFNVLSRNNEEIDSFIHNERFAVVGTYSMTGKRLWVFIKLIDIYTGHILGSASESTIMTSEIEELERVPLKRSDNIIYKPLVL